MFSDSFQQLYGDTTLYEPFSTFHPVSLARVLPFQPDDPVIDDSALLGAEMAHLAARSDLTRSEVIDAYARCDLLSADDAGHVKSVLDLYDADFFELMGLVYANAGMYICALRWYREIIREVEAPRTSLHPGIDPDGVHASIGYCLYALGLFPEAIAWTKSCVGPRLVADTASEALLDYEARRVGGRLRGVERAGGRIRYTLSASDPAAARQITPQLKAALKSTALAPEFHLDWITETASLPASLAPAEPSSDDPSPPDHQPLFDPVWMVRDNGDLPRHKLNLVFASHAWARELTEKGFIMEANQLLSEAALLEPSATFINPL